MKDKLLS